MRVTRLIGPVLLLALALVAESVWLTAIGLPGAVPPLVLVNILALARTRTAQNAAVIGFALGLLVDLVPPSATPVGVSAFAFALAAFGFSFAKPLLEGSNFLTLASVSIAAAGVVVVRAILGLAIGAASTPLSSVLVDLVTAPLYAIMLATFVFPIMARVERIAAPPRQQTIFR